MIESIKQIKKLLKKLTMLLKWSSDSKQSRFFKNVYEIRVKSKIKRFKFQSILGRHI